MITTTRKKKKQYLEKMGEKTIVLIFQATNKQILTREDLDKAKKGKPEERNWIYSDSFIKQCHNDQLC